VDCHVWKAWLKQGSLDSVHQEGCVSLTAQKACHVQPAALSSMKKSSVLWRQAGCTMKSPGSDATVKLA
jgi:hypothetical protein